jgi:poly-gamma-glutamate synthesis protein (capsule biosynthesis protein)
MDKVSLFLCGDVMTGRGIDQILPFPVSPVIYESYLSNAQRYVELAESVNGPILYPVQFSYIWGDALEEFMIHKPDLRIINLETSVTRCEDYWVNKGINYRMSPENIECLKIASIDCCALANNHILDWGYCGLGDTLTSLDNAGIKHAGAGMSDEDAKKPAVFELQGKGRVVIYSLGSETSGIPSEWAATENKAGVDFIDEAKSFHAIDKIRSRIDRFKKPGDKVIVSIHWGENWGYRIPPDQINLAHHLIDDSGVDIVHGHSSHHVKGFEVYKNKLILYGCGDFINDYEGIGGFEKFRSRLVLMYFVTLNAKGCLDSCSIIPMSVRNFRLSRASLEDSKWLLDLFKNRSHINGAELCMEPNGNLQLHC